MSSRRPPRFWLLGTAPKKSRAALSSWPALQFVVQSPQLGTGHALLQTGPRFTGKTGTVLLLYADVPLLQSGTLARLIDAHQSRARPPRS